MMDNEKIIRKKVFVYGAVQGVGFRYRAEHAANMLGVTGWVRNEPEGYNDVGQRKYHNNKMRYFLCPT